MAIFRPPTKEGWPSGLRHTPGTRAYVKAYRGFESLLFRHSALGQISLPQIPAAKIPSICGLLRANLLTAGMVARPNFVSLRPIFSKAPDCPEKYGDHNNLKINGNSTRSLLEFNTAKRCARRPGVKNLPAKSDSRTCSLLTFGFCAQWIIARTAPRKRRALGGIGGEA